MADYLAACLTDLGDQLDAVLGWLTMHGMSKETLCYVFGAIALFVIYSAVRSAVRIALLRCPVRK